MINEKRMTQFEAVYGQLRDINPDAVKMHRFKTKESYDLPAVASDYRLFCAALDSVVVELPAEYGADRLVSKAERHAQRSAISLCSEAIEAAGVRVKL